jgi:ectoine hydroxylase-related dioxygenase (phytanoyl-CoA dioxygenase family)
MTRLAFSRYVAGRFERALYRKNRALFEMAEAERRHGEELQRQGYTVLPEFFDTAVVDPLFDRADRLFRDLHVDPTQAYSVQNRQRTSLEGLSYEELAATEKMIALRDPLLSMPECIPIVFHASILKIVTNFLGYVVPWYKPLIVRDFPGDRPRESSNFHRDNDEADSVQVFVYLVDIDDSRGPLVYVPGTNRYDVQSCRPRLTRDLGISGYDGRISDEEIEKYYPRDSWSVLRVKRGSVAIIHGNGFHKGPAWPRYGSASNQPRTAFRLDFNGHKLGKATNRWKKVRIRAADYARLTPLQRLFTEESAVVGRE